MPTSPRTLSHPDRVLEVTDPRTLRALAHPLRLRLLRALRESQPATGAELAAQLDESTASVSYHLGVLARHGFVEPDPAPGPTRRHKPWRTTYGSLRIVGAADGMPPGESPEGVVLATMLGDARRQQDDYLRGAGVLGGWADTASFQLTDLVLATDELDALTDEVGALVERYRGRAREAGRARVSVSFVAVPTSVYPDGGVP